MDYAPNFINLIGQTFGELYVFEKAENDPKGCARFLARCSCGDERRYESKELRNLKRTACPKCLREAKKKVTAERNEAAAQKLLEEKGKENKKKYDISGLKVKDWLVLNPVVEKSFGGAYVCECKCGTLFNFNRNVILREKLGRFCKRCLLEDNERVRSKKKKDILKKDSANCPKCNLELKIKDFDKSSLKDGVLICYKCKKEYGDKIREKWFKENKLKDYFDCPQCFRIFERSTVSDLSLKAKRPICCECSKVKLEERMSLYETENLKKEFLKCSKCGVEKKLDQYHPSFLKFSSPRCGSCSSIYGRDYDKKRFARDPIYKEKRDIGRKIAQSLDKRGWKKGFTAVEYLGIDRDGFVLHIESLFREGMSWGNRGLWHLDHVTPLSTAMTSEDIKALWHYTNLQPLWKSENEEKSNLLDWRDRFEWAKEVVEIRRKNGLE